MHTVQEFQFEKGNEQVYCGNTKHNFALNHIDVHI